MKAVECRGISKDFSTGDSVVHALRGVDLDVHPGELIMIVGPSGCGKTTLISVIAGILRPDQGECRVFGEELNRLSERRRTAFRGKHIGFVFQAYNLIPTLTAAENVSVPLVIQGASLKDAMRPAREALARVGLGDRTTSYPRQLSGGQQQRVAIARALVHSPRLIVCDEPTSALDHENGMRVMEVFREVGLQDGRALIVVTHDARIFRYADRIARMDDGLIQGIEQPTQEMQEA